MMDPLLIFFREDWLELWSIDKNGRLRPLEYQNSNRVPLYFVLSGDQILMDGYAKESFKKNAPNSFGNFWKNLGNQSLTYKRFGAVNSFESLLHYALKENIFPQLIRDYFPSCTFSEFLSGANNFVLFDSFISEEQSCLVNKGFFEIIGFSPNSLKFLDYWELFRSSQTTARNLSNDEPFIFVNASLGDFYFHVIGKSDPITRFILEGKGNDPRIDTLLEFVAEIAISKGSHLQLPDLKRELQSEGPILLELLRNNLVIHTVRNDNIGVNPLKLTFNRVDVEARLNNRQTLNLIQNSFDTYRRSNNAERSRIFLSGDLVNQEAFSSFFKTTYSLVTNVDDKNDETMLQLALRANISGQKPAPVPPQPNGFTGAPQTPRPAQSLGTPQAPPPVAAPRAPIPTSPAPLATPAPAPVTPGRPPVAPLPPAPNPGPPRVAQPPQAPKPPSAPPQAPRPSAPPQPPAPPQVARPVTPPRPSAPAPAPPPRPSGPPSPPRPSAPPPTMVSRFSVKLEEVDSNKVAIANLIKIQLDCTLAEARQYVAKVPITLARNLDRKEAEVIVSQLTKAGAKAKVE